ncbi:MAG: 2,3-bisphosphoglycerate-independent phosphoglycerate mutase [Deltaproteobacteria bacterium]|nr:2,3-bisphosphoglycerate-independent phosphoglycerate mutase [Deltaproteobacteria bacterium]
MDDDNRSAPLVLRGHPVLPAPAGPVVLLILDGVGVGAGDEFDALALARTPTLDSLRRDGLAATLRAHGTAVGLPSDADIGNSEVGHNIMGAGRVFDQGAKCVDQAIETGALYDGYWKTLVERVRAGGGALHFMGLLSDGNVHSHEAHLHALIRRADHEGLERVYVHALLDGRDVPDRTAPVYLERLETVLAAIRDQGGRDYRIASGGGRMVVTMDRYEADWSIVARGWRAHVLGEAEGFSSAAAAVEHFRAAQPGISDQVLPAFTVRNADGSPVAPIEDGDGVIFFNFRGDRAMEMSRAFTEGAGFDRFDRGRVPDVAFAGMMLYDGDLGIPEHYLVAPPEVSRTLGEYLAAAGVPQFACAETQKYGHVTYFWNGNRSGKFDDALEEYVEIASEQVPFEQRPWMRSAETADAVNRAIWERRYRFIRANFAGGDMVGHTGNLEATVRAVEAIDRALGRILAAVAAVHGCLVVTADHGNSEDMVERDKDGAPLYEDGKPVFRTAHSINPVPFVVRDFSDRRYSLAPPPDAGLANLAATLLELLGYHPPEEFAPSLLRVPVDPPSRPGVDSLHGREG